MVTIANPGAVGVRLVACLAYFSPEAPPDFVASHANWRRGILIQFGRGAAVLRAGHVDEFVLVGRRKSTG